MRPAAAAIVVSFAAFVAIPQASAAAAAPTMPGAVAVFPVENLTGAAVSVGGAEAALRAALEAASVPLLAPERLQAFFDDARVRYMGGLSRSVAPLLREATGTPAALIASLDLWDPGDPPRVAMTARLVTTDDTPKVQWMDSVTMAGDETPGFLQTGLIHDPDLLLNEVVHRLVASMLAPKDRAFRRESVDEGPRRFRPRRLYIAPEPVGESGRPIRVAVVPFTSRVKRRSAGEIVQLKFVEQLTRQDRFEVVEPGVVRQLLLDTRIIPARGVSLAQADLLKQLLKADLVVSGNVYEFKDGTSQSGDARVDISLVALDASRRAVAWTAFSGVGGSAGVLLFDKGRLRSGAAVADALSRAVIVAAARAQRGHR